MSSTLEIPTVLQIPRHLAIIMDGNGRWATRRKLPRVAGHKKGVDAVRLVVEYCAQKGVDFLTLFAFSSENWRRPREEVTVLMRLFIMALEREVNKLHKNNIRLKIVGDLSAFETKLQTLIRQAEEKTYKNTGLTLTIAANYGGRWDILQAMQKTVAQAPVGSELFTEDVFEKNLAMHFAPEPDLFIRTGGEQRVSNFLIWQLAYTELYFTECCWPDFNIAELELALEFYRTRERRFGRTSEQLWASVEGNKK